MRAGADEDRECRVDCGEERFDMRREVMDDIDEDIGVASLQCCETVGSSWSGGNSAKASAASQILAVSNSLG